MLILNYHGIEKFDGEYPWQPGEKRYAVALERFEQQLNLILKWLTQPQMVPGTDGTGSGNLSLDVPGTFQRQNELVGHPTILLTFDDGHISHLLHAAPALKRHGLNAVFFISAGFLGKANYLSVDQVKTLIKMGFEIGSHGFHHIPLTRLPVDRLVYEITASKTHLENALGIRIRAFSVPRGYYLPAISQIARQCGYSYVFTSDYGQNEPGKSDLFKLKRVAVLPEMTDSEFFRILNGHLGLRGLREFVKSQVRNSVPAPVYDFLAAVKGKIRL